MSDLKDTVCKKCNLLLLSETNSNNDSNIGIINFTCISKFKRENIRSGGVSINHNNSDTVKIVTPNISLNARNSIHEVAASSAIGDLCSVQCKLNDGNVIIIFCI